MRFPPVVFPLLPRGFWDNWSLFSILAFGESLFSATLNLAWGIVFFLLFIKTHFVFELEVHVLNDSF